MRNIRSYGGVVCTMMLLCATEARAVTVVIDETAFHVMADTETRAGARDACILSADRQALAKAGMMVDAGINTNAREGAGGVVRSASQWGGAYIAGIVTSHEINESWAASSRGITVYCEVRVGFDPEEVKGLLEDAERKAQAARAEAMQRSQSDDIIAKIDALTARARKIRHGMTLEEVIAYMGPPRAVDKSEWWSQDWYNWGGVWVGVNDGVVVCVCPNRNRFSDGMFRDDN